MGTALQMSTVQVLFDNGTGDLVKPSGAPVPVPNSSIPDPLVLDSMRVDTIGVKTPANDAPEFIDGIKVPTGKRLRMEDGTKVVIGPLEDPWNAPTLGIAPYVADGVIGVYKDYGTDNTPATIHMPVCVISNNLGSAFVRAIQGDVQGAQVSAFVGRARSTSGNPNENAVTERLYVAAAHATTTLVTPIVLPLVPTTIDVTSTDGVYINVRSRISVNGTYYSFTGATGTSFTGVAYVSGINTGTIPAGSAVGYSIGGGAHAMVIECFGGNDGSADINDFIAFRASSSDVARALTGLVFIGPSIASTGTVISARQEACSFGIDLRGSKFTVSSLYCDVNSGSTAASAGLRVRTSGGFVNTGHAILLEAGDVSSTVSTGFRITGNPTGSAGSLIKADAAATAYGIDLNGSTFSGAVIRIGGSSTGSGILFQTDGTGIGQSVVWGAASDTRLWRGGAGILETTSGMRAKRFMCSSGVPVVLALAGAGTGASATITGSDAGFVVVLTTGTGTPTGALFRVTWAIAATNTPIACVSAYSANAAAVAVNISTISTTLVELSTAATLSASTAYTWSFVTSRWG